MSNIHKNGKMTSIQPSLKSNATSFILDNFLSKMYVKYLPLVSGNFLFEVELLVFTNIKCYHHHVDQMHLKLNDELLEEVDYFKYPGLQVAADGGCERDVVHRMNEGCRLRKH